MLSWVAVGLGPGSALPASFRVSVAWLGLMEEQTGGAQMEEDVCLSHHRVATRMHFRELVAALCLCVSPVASSFPCVPSLPFCLPRRR